MDAIRLHRVLALSLVLALPSFSVLLKVATSCVRREIAGSDEISWAMLTFAPALNDNIR